MAMPRSQPAPALSEVEGVAWGGFLRVHALITRQLDADLRARAEVTLAEFEILLHLASSNGERRMAQIAHDALLTGGGVTRIVGRLEKLGLIERRSCPKDGRGIFAVLTDKGWTKQRAAQRIHIEGIRRLFFANVGESDLRTLGRFFAAATIRARGGPTPGDAEACDQRAPASRVRGRYRGQTGITPAE